MSSPPSSSTSPPPPPPPQPQRQPAAAQPTGTSATLPTRGRGVRRHNSTGNAVYNASSMPTRRRVTSISGGTPGEPASSGSSPGPGPDSSARPNHRSSPRPTPNRLDLSAITGQAAGSHGGGGVIGGRSFISQSSASGVFTDADVTSSLTSAASVRQQSLMLSAQLANKTATSTPANDGTGAVNVVVRGPSGLSASIETNTTTSAPKESTLTALFARERPSPGLPPSSPDDLLTPRFAISSASSSTTAPSSSSSSPSSTPSEHNAAHGLATTPTPTNVAGRTLLASPHPATSTLASSLRYIDPEAAQRVAQQEAHVAHQAATAHARSEHKVIAGADKRHAAGENADDGDEEHTAGVYCGEAGNAFFPDHHLPSPRRESKSGGRSASTTGGSRQRRGRRVSLLQQQQVTESTPLLAGSAAAATRDDGTPVPGMPRARGTISIAGDLAVDSLSVLPAVTLGLILNILDGLSFGYILFPISDTLFADMGSDGISLFFVSTLISQVVFTTMSTFRCGVGSMIIEVIPFLHTMARAIAAELAPRGIDPMPTVMAAFIGSTVLTSIAFFLLGAFRLGNVMAFFPRHILVGSIGGVGYFLLATAIEVSAKVKVEYNLPALWSIISPLALAQWGSSLAVAILLRFMLVTHLDRRLLGTNPRRRGMFVPCFFMLVPLVFHLILYLANIDLAVAREYGWLFDLAADKPFYDFYRHMRPGDVAWGLLPSLLPTMLSLAFFSVLHVPINVPALAVSTHAGVSVNRELANHGVANLVSAMFGSVQNYLVYSTSVMLHRSGGDSRTAGYLLTVLTLIVWTCGQGVMQLVPTVVVGALMFHLGVDLLKEAVWDTRGLVTPLEYGTIVAIITSMALLGFTEGVGIGILLACVFFVATYSTRARSAVIARDRVGTLWGTPVRRMPYHRRLLAQWAKHTVHVLELQGFIFFGTVHHVTKHVQDMVEPGRQVGAAAERAKKRRRRIVWPDYSDGLPGAGIEEEEQEHAGFDGDDVPEFPPRSAKPNELGARPQFLILDFARVEDIDFSAGEAFVKLQRLLAAHKIGLVLAGVGGSEHGHIAKALQRAGVWPNARVGLGDRTGVVCCATLTGALEYCENAVLAGAEMPTPSDAVLALAATAAVAEGSIKLSPVGEGQEARQVGEETGPSSDLTVVGPEQHQQIKVLQVVDQELVVLAAMVLGGSGLIIDDPTTATSGGQPVHDDEMQRTVDLDASLFATTVLVDGVNPSQYAPLFERRVLAPGSVLWRAGDHADSVVFVLRGAICEGRVAPPRAVLVGSQTESSLVLLGSAPSWVDDDVAAAAAAVAAVRQNQPDTATWDPDARWITSLPGTVVGARSFITMTRRTRACWVAPLELSGGRRSRVGTGGTASPTGDWPMSGEGGLDTVVYVVKREVMDRLPPAVALQLVRMIVRVDER